MACAKCEERRKLFVEARAAYDRGDIETAKTLMQEIVKSTLKSIKGPFAK